jgi:hypothetical protein
MIEKNRKEFFDLIANVYAFYRQDFSTFAGGVWWEAMKPFDLKAVAEALSRHCVNPDSGQFMPKPADVVKMLQGSTLDSALVAWSKLERAISAVGSYQSVVFDDALIHRIVGEMGGWIGFGAKSMDEWPFVKNEFVNRYRGYKMRSQTPDYPPVLIGISEANNGKRGYNIEAPTLVGDQAQARLVLSGGSNKPILEFRQMDSGEAVEALGLVDARTAA